MTVCNWDIRFDGQAIQNTFKGWDAVQEQVNRLFTVVQQHFYVWLTNIDVEDELGQDEAMRMDAYLEGHANEWQRLRMTIDDKYLDYTFSAKGEAEIYEIQAFICREAQCISDGLLEALNLM